jgi:dTDP-4-amino-4,6-dideoxygalactose transaminase
VPGGPRERATLRSASGSTRPAVPLLRPELPPLESYVELLEEIWETRLLSNFGAFAQRLEASAASYMGVPEALAVVNCDVGLTLAIAALRPRAGSKAILPSFTFASTVNAVRWNGLEPQFADVDPHTWCLDPDAVARHLADGAGLVVGMHTFGVACDVEALGDLAAQSGVPLLFDAAHAIGTWVGGRHAATFGDASVISLSGTKVVTSGEGGLAVFRDPEAAERFRHLRNYGFRGDYQPRVAGLNGKLSELHAALGCLTIERIEDLVGARARLVGRYRELLAPLGVGFQAFAPSIRPSHGYLAVVVGEGRDGLAARLAREGIETKKYFHPLHLVPDIVAAAPTLPVTERLASTSLCLPLYPDLAQEDLERVCATIADHVAGDRR